MTDRLTIRRPDDWHLHLRDGALLAAVLPFTARQFGRAIVMPNLVPPITTVAAARAYEARIRAALPPDARFTPLMTCYLTDGFDKAELERGWGERVFVAAKLYPARATTNSEFGVTDLRKITPLLETMARLGMPLLVHGEVVDPAVDIFDREAVFIDRVLAPLLRDLPGLRVVFEHVTTAEAVAFVEATPENLGATITAHHLVINRNALFQGGLRPHAYCLPVAKRERHRLALRRAAVSGDPRFFLGTDSAPHPARDKEAACGCAGIFSAPAALETYLGVFEAEGALDRFEGFAALHGAAFYKLPVSEARVSLTRRAWTVPESIPAAGGQLVPFHAGERLAWQLDEDGARA
jgi:dihydroorotase